MKFDTWFKQQFGKRPSKEPTCELEIKVRDLGLELGAARELLNECNRYDYQYQSALYAWKIQDSDKS